MNSFAAAGPAAGTATGPAAGPATGPARHGTPLGIRVQERQPPQLLLDFFIT